MEALRDLRHEFYNPALDARQQECRAALSEAHAAGVPRGYLNMATGTGKTEIAADDVAAYIAENPEAKVLYLCRRESILEQANETFQEVLGPDVSHGMIIGGEMSHDKQVTMASFQQLNRQVDDRSLYELIPPGYYDYVVVDESHHGPAETYRRVIEHLEPDFLLGLTATPRRRDEQAIEEIFGETIYEYQLDEAIAEGAVARPDYRLLTDHVKRLEELGDELQTLTDAQLNCEIFIPRRDGEIADMIAEHLYEKEDPRTVVYCNSTAYADHMTDYLPGKVAALHSRVPKEEREEIRHKFKTGELDMLVTVNMFDEGENIPEANVIVFLGSTESETKFLQRLGRGLRKAAGKDEVLVLDFVSMWERINFVSGLANKVKQNYKKGVESGRVRRLHKTPFRFDFSEETFNAIELIQFARSKGPARPKPVVKSRTEKWEREDQELSKMLGIDRLPQQRISVHEWQRFSERLAVGDEHAKNTLILRNLRRLYGTAQTHHEQLKSNEVTVEDLFQEGCESFIKAIEKYDPKVHGELRNYVLLRIYGGIHRAAEKRGLAVGNKHYATIEKIEKARNELGKNIPKNEITEEVIAKEVGKTVKIVQAVRFAATHLEREEILSLDDIVDISEAESEDLAFEIAAENELADNVRNALKNLGAREQYILKTRYGLGGTAQKTMGELAEVLKVNRSRIGQIEKQALKKLQSMAEDNRLGNLLDGPIRTVPVLTESETYTAAYILDRERRQMKEGLIVDYIGSTEGFSHHEIAKRSLAQTVTRALDVLDNRTSFGDLPSLSQLHAETMRRLRNGFSALSDQEFFGTIGKLVETGQIRTFESEDGKVMHVRPNKTSR